MQDPDSGLIDGWIVEVSDNGKKWDFRGVTFEEIDFMPEFASDLSLYGDNGHWKCTKERDVFDDVKCSRSIEDFKWARPESPVLWWGYRSDGRFHSWEKAFAVKNFKGTPPSKEGE